MLRLLASTLLVVCLGYGCAIADMRPPNGCAEFHNEYQMDRGASDVYIGVQKADNEGACFLVPRSVTDLLVRKYYVDAGLINVVGFEPLDLQHYLQGKSEIIVGEQRRAITPEIQSCVRQIVPEVTGIFSGPLYKPIALSRLTSMEKLPDDVPGYNRYQQPGWLPNYYIAENQSREVKTFECGPHEGGEACVFHGEYDRMKIGIMYWKADINQVIPEDALECVRKIGALFRME